MRKPTLEVIFAEFGGKFNPDIDNVKQYFPEAKISIFTNKDCEDVFGDRSAFPDKWGYHMNDYWKVAKLLASEADIAIAFDADMRIVSDNVRAIIPLTINFGVCLPVNPRNLVKIDTEVGSHSDKKLDDTLGMGHAVNMTPIAFLNSRVRAEALLYNYLNTMKANPVRGTLAMWRAIYDTGIMPCLLPRQWCVCAEDVGIGNEIILHIGHDKVREHYNV